MHKRLLHLGASVVFAAALAFAQGPGEPGAPPDPQMMIGMRVDFLTRLLNLTDAQKTKATAIFTDAFSASESIRTSLHTNRQSLSDAVKKNDAASIDSLSATAGTLTGQLISIESKAEAAFRTILTADQQTKYDSMPHRGFGGPGGPGGPGGGMGPAAFGPRGRSSRAAQ